MSIMTENRWWALAHFRKEDRYAEYLRLYGECLGRETY